MWIYSKRLDLLLLRKIGLPLTEGAVRMTRSRVNKKRPSLSNTVTGTTQVTPVSMKFIWRGMMALNVMFLLRCSKGEHGVLFLIQLWPDADLQLALLIPQDPWVHSFPQENPTVMCPLSEKEVWEKGNQSNYLALAFIFYPIFFY